MMRAQRPMVVEIRGLIPPFSLEQFMAVRVHLKFDFSQNVAEDDCYYLYVFNYLIAVRQFHWFLHHDLEDFDPGKQLVYVNFVIV